MSKSCLVWFANCTDISNTSHSGLTTGSFWSSAVARKCFSPESAECCSIPPLLSFVSASCSLKGKKKILGRGWGKESWCLGSYIPWVSVSFSWVGQEHIWITWNLVFGVMGFGAVWSFSKVELQSQSKGNIYSKVLEWSAWRGGGFTISGCV